MTRTARTAALTTLTALAAIAAIIAADFTAPVSAQSDDLMLDSPGEAPSSGRIAARRLSDGRTELAWQPRTNTGWGTLIFPRPRTLSRTFPTDAAFGNWLRTGPVMVGGVEIGRIEARKRRDRGIELAFTPTGGERIEPFGNYILSNITPAHGWVNTSEIDPAVFLARQIAERFAPVILFEEGEQYFPVPVELMIRYSTLHYTQNGQPRMKAAGTYRLTDLISHNGRDSYLDLGDWARDYEFDTERVVYARVAETYGANAGVLVQYWFFYLYNATGEPTHSHEGDWEGIQLWFAGLTPADLLTANVPTQVGYAAHESGWALTPDAESCAAINAPAVPNVYVARNRHASYPKSGSGGEFDKSFPGWARDQFQGNGAAWALQGVAVPDVEGELGYELRMLPTDPNQSWLAWTGRWGDPESGSGGPRGPAFKSHFWLPPVRNGWSLAEFDCWSRYR